MDHVVFVGGGRWLLGWEKADNHFIKQLDFAPKSPQSLVFVTLLFAILFGISSFTLFFFIFPHNPRDIRPELHALGKSVSMITFMDVIGSRSCSRPLLFEGYAPKGLRLL